MGCNNSKTKEKRRKDGATPITGEQAVEGAGEAAAYSVDTTAPHAALVSELAQPTPEEKASSLEEEQRAGVEVKDEDSEPKSLTDDDRRTSAERHSEIAAACGVSDALTRAALPETERSSALKSGDEDPAETDDVSESPTRAPRSAKSHSSSLSRDQEPAQDTTSVGSHIEFEVENGNTEGVAEGETEVELSLPRSSTPRSSSRSRRVPAPVSPPAVEPSASRTETTTPSAGEGIAPPTARIASSCSSQSPHLSAHPFKDSGASSQSTSPVYRPLPKEGQLPSRASSAPHERSLTPSVASSFSAAERSSERASGRYLQEASAYSEGSTPPSRPHVPPSLAEPLHEYGASVDDRTAAAVVAVGVPRTVLDQFPYRPGPADASRPHSSYESQSAFVERCRGVVSPIPYRQGYTDPTPGAMPRKFLTSTMYMPPPTAYRVVTADGAPSRLSFDPSQFAAIEASRTKLIRAYAVS